MEDPTLDRRSVLKRTGAAGADPAGIETTTGNTDPQFELGAPEEFYVDVEIANGEGETETPTLYGEIVRPVCSCSGEPIEDVPVVLTYTPYGDLYQPLNDGDSPALDGVAEYSSRGATPGRCSTSSAAGTPAATTTTGVSASA